MTVAARRFSLLLAAAAWALFLPGLAHAGSDGSSYSQLGIGDLRGFAGIRYAGMGYTGLALFDVHSVSAISPAAWSRIKSTQIDAGYLYQGYNSTDGENSRYLAGGSFSGGMVAIPLSPARGLVLGFGFVPLSSVGYNTYYNAADTLMPHRVNVKGSGGFTRGQVGASYEPVEGLALGATFAYVFGRIVDERVQYPSDPSYSGGTVREQLAGRGPGFTAGLRFDRFDRLTPALEGLSLGLFYASRISLTTTSQFTYQFSADKDTLAEVTSTAAVPAALGLGAAYRIDARHLVAADYRRQAWSTADITRFRGGDLRDTYRVSIGAERGILREPAATWGERVALRLGGFYEHSYYAPDGTGINGWGITAGASIPLGTETWLNLSAEYGGRGTTDNNLIRDNIFRFGVGLNLSELWFVRYEEE